MCTQKMAFVFILTTVVLMFLMCVPFSLSADIVSHPATGKMCIFTDNSVIKLVRDEVTWFYIELLVHFIMPFVVIILANCNIVFKVIILIITRRRGFKLVHGDLSA